MYSLLNITCRFDKYLLWSIHSQVIRPLAPPHSGTNLYLTSDMLLHPSPIRKLAVCVHALIIRSFQLTGIAPSQQNTYSTRHWEMTIWKDDIEHSTQVHEEALWDVSTLTPIFNEILCTKTFWCVLILSHPKRFCVLSQILKCGKILSN